MSNNIARTRAVQQEQAMLELRARAKVPFVGNEPQQPIVPDWIHHYIDGSHELRLLGGALYCARCGGITKQPTGQSKLSKGKKCLGIPANAKSETLRATQRKLNQLNAGRWHPALASPWPDLMGGTGPRTPHSLHCVKGFWRVFEE